MVRSKKRSLDWIIELLKNVGYIKWMYYYRETGIVEIIAAGRVAIDARTLEAMKKGRLILDSISNSIAPEFLDNLGEFPEVRDEDDVPEFMCTTIRLKDTELPPLEHVGESDISELTQIGVNH